jgi:hypothetical protein
MALALLLCFGAAGTLLDRVPEQAACAGAVKGSMVKHRFRLENCEIG